MTEQNVPVRSDARDMVRWKNITGGTIPAYAAIQLGAYYIDDQYYDVDKYNPDANGLVVINGPHAVRDNQYGESSLSKAVELVMFAPGGSADLWSEIGPTPSQFYFSESESGWQVHGDVDSTNDLIPCRQVSFGVTSSSGSGGCCTCVDTPDMVDPDGVKTRVRWAVPLDTVTVDLTGVGKVGTGTVAAGIYIVSWDEGEESWILVGGALHDFYVQLDEDGQPTNRTVQVSLRFRKNSADWMTTELLFTDVPVAVWSNHTRHFQRLCSNELKADTPANTTLTSGCEVCVTPASPLTTPCSDRVYGIGNGAPIMEVSSSLTPRPANEIPYYEQWNQYWHLLTEAMGNNPGLGRLSLDGRCNGRVTTRGFASIRPLGNPLGSTNAIARWRMAMEVLNREQSFGWETTEMSVRISGDLGYESTSPFSSALFWGFDTFWQSSLQAPYPSPLAPGSGPVTMNLIHSEIFIYSGGSGGKIESNPFDLASWFNYDSSDDGELIGF